MQSLSRFKSQSKWWDGYAGESHVLLDDMDGNFLGHCLKIWADKYACTGEIKGGVVKLSHTAFIITSNYLIEELWKDDTIMAAAIKRRFEVVHMTTPHMFSPKPPLSSLQAQSNHIFGTIPMQLHPVRDRKAPPNPCVELWRKKKNPVSKEEEIKNPVVLPTRPDRPSDVSDEEENVDVGLSPGH